MHGSPRFPGALVLLAGAVAAVMLAGCGGKKEPQENPAAAHLRTIILAYDEYIYTKRRPPRSMDDLRPVLQAIGGQDPEALLRSPNDGEPYVIVWGINLEKVTDGSLLLAYEKKGVDGKRYAINAARLVKQLTDAEMEKGGSPRGKRPAGG